MQDTYLNSEQAAAYLGIKERKLYELVGAGRIPATKATGKWLFPRAALDRWLEAGLVIPPGYAPRLPPKIIAGSQDPLLDWAARRSGSGLALLAEGSEAGLRHLEQNDAAMAAIHLHMHDSTIDDAESNVEAVRASPHLADAVVIHFAAREQGLMMKVERKIGSVGDAVAQGLVFGTRQAGAGAQLLLEKLIAAENQTLDSTSKCNFLKRVEVAETMVGSQFPLTWQSKKHDDLSPSQPRRTLSDFRLVERGADPVPDCPEPRAA